MKLIEFCLLYPRISTQCGLYYLPWPSQEGLLEPAKRGKVAKCVGKARPGLAANWVVR